MTHLTGLRKRIKKQFEQENKFFLFEVLHHCTFKSPIIGRFISGMATLPCAFEMRKGVIK
jgi:hypothetical protein